MLGFNNFELFIKEIGFNIKPYAFKFQGTLVAFKVNFPFSLFVSFTNGNKIPVVAVTFAYEASLSTVFRQLFPALAWMPPLMEVCFFGVFARFLLLLELPSDAACLYRVCPTPRPPATDQQPVGRL
jgi:hypothetical protein